MITKEGFNANKEHIWKLHVPDEFCAPGLEVGIYATSTGLLIAGNLISCGELEIAKREAQKISHLEIVR